MTIVDDLRRITPARLIVLDVSSLVPFSHLDHVARKELDEQSVAKYEQRKAELLRHFVPHVLVRDALATFIYESATEGQ